MNCEITIYYTTIPQAIEWDGIEYRFHSNAVEPRNILATLRRQAERQYGFTFDRVHREYDNGYKVVYTAEAYETCD